MPFGPRNAPTFYTLVTRMIQEEATTLFRLLCNEATVDLHKDESRQPEFVISNLPRTDDYKQSCTGDYLPRLQLDPRYSSSDKDSPIMQTKYKHPCTDNGCLTIRQRMRNSNDFHLTGSRDIIDDIMLRSTSISLLILL